MNPIRLPEIQSIDRLLDDIKQMSGEPNVALALGHQFASNAEIAPARGLLELMQLVCSLRSLIPDFPATGQRRVAERTIDRIERLFDPEPLSWNIKTFRNHFSSAIEQIKDNLPLFDDIGYDESISLTHIELIKHIANLRSKIASSEFISTETKSLILAQMDLLASSVNRFNTMGIGPFRDAVFLAYGKISIQLESDKESRADEKRAIMDDIRQLHGLAEGNGNLRRLGTSTPVPRLSGPPASQDKQ